MRQVFDLVDVEIDVKRFYLPGVSFSRPCPNCKAQVKREFEGNYLSHPSVGVEFQLHMWCNKCDHEFCIPAKLNLSLELPEQER